MTRAARALVLLAAARAASAAPRPSLSGPELRYEPPGGRFLIHYTLEGDDAPADPRDDDPPNGVPDLVDDFAAGMERSWAVFVGEDGWPAPLGDEGRGGDDRVDAYVRAIDAYGYAHYEAVRGGGHAAYLELSPRDGTLGRAGARSVAAHELHHAMQAALTVGAGPWIYEATASWAQFLLYEDDALVALARDALWLFRLQGAGRGLADTGERFEYAGMAWLKFLMDHGRAPRGAMLDLWRAMADAGGWVDGHRAALPERFGLDTLDDAVATFHEWNLFACRRDDGRHYAPSPLGCGWMAEVPVTRAAPGGSGRTAPVGPYGAAYLEFERDCATARLVVRVSGARPFAVRAVRVRAGGGSLVEPLASVGEPVEAMVPGWNDAARTVLVLVNLDGAKASALDWSASADGSYAPDPDPAAAARVAIAPAGPLALARGESAMLGARAWFDSCADGPDGVEVTARAPWRSSDEGVATVEAGTVRAVGPGRAEISVATDAPDGSNRVSVEVRGCGCAIGGRRAGGGGAAGGALLLLAATSRGSRRRRGTPRPA